MRKLILAALLGAASLPAAAQPITRYDCYSLPPSMERSDCFRWIDRQRERQAYWRREESEERREHLRWLEEERRRQEWQRREDRRQFERMTRPW